MSKHHTCLQANRGVNRGEHLMLETHLLLSSSSPLLFKEQGVGCQLDKTCAYMNSDLLSLWQSSRVPTENNSTTCRATQMRAWIVRAAGVLLSRFLRSGLKAAPSVTWRGKGTIRLWVSVLLGSHIPFAGHIAAFHLCSPVCIYPLSALCSAFWAEFKHWGPV